MVLECENDAGLMTLASCGTEKFENQLDGAVHQMGQESDFIAYYALQSSYSSDFGELITFVTYTSSC
jgi:hypothetical protein